MLRRSLMITAGACAALALAACSTAQAQKIEAQAVADLGLVATGLETFSPLLAAIPGAPAGAITDAEAIIAEISAAAATVTSTTTEVAAQPIVSQIEGYFNSLLSIVSGISLPASAAKYLTAAKTLLPLIEAAVGLAIAVGVPSTGMPPAEARAILAS